MQKNLCYKQFTKKLEKFSKPLYEINRQWSVAEVIAKDYFGANHALFDNRGVEKARALEQVTRHLKVHNLMR